MKTLTQIIFATLLATTATNYASASIALQSPDKNVTVNFDIASNDNHSSTPCYSVQVDGKIRITTSALGIDLAPAGAFGPLKITGVENNAIDQTYKQFPGKASSVRDHYNEAIVSLAETGDHHRRMDIIFRAYNDGAAFRYHIPKQPGLKNFTVTEEQSEFKIAGNPMAYILPVETFDTPYEAYYKPQKIEEAQGDELIGLPLLMQYPDQSCIAITEAHLHDYAGMYLTPTTGTSNLLRSRLAPRHDQSQFLGAPSIKVISTLPHDTPWRVIMIGDNPGRLIESNLVNNLNPPNAIGDTSWIKPGKTTFPWWNGFAAGKDVKFKPGLNTATMKHYIDFCAESGIEYHSLDGFHNVAWYGGPINPYEGQSITTSTLPDFDLAEVIRYAKEKGVALRFWMNWLAARQHMEQAFPQYEKWGIEGVMLDFFNRDDQEAVDFIEKAVALAAKHHLTITLHNLYKPTGLNRTYPNLMTYEGVMNLEYNKWDKKGSTPEHEMIVPFTRMLAGPMDYHSGGFRYVDVEHFKPHRTGPLVMGTRARELARYVVYEGYLPMAADYPAAYRGQKGLDVLVHTPTTWDETRVVNGAIGDDITIARRSGKNWYVGSMDDNTARELAIPLDFLGDGKYKAQIFSDDKSPDAKREDMKTSERTVTAKDTIKVDLIKAGGNLVILTPQN